MIPKNKNTSMKPLKNILDIQFVKRNKAMAIFYAYFIIGIIYIVTSHLYAILIGRVNILSLLVSIPWGAPFWPLLVYTDLKHIGVMPQDVLAFISIIIFITILIKNPSDKKPPQ